MRDARPIAELSLVRLKRDSGDLRAGMTGTVVHLHGDGIEACVVEFTDGLKTIVLADLKVEDLEVTWSPYGNPGGKENG
jgi:Domain of unknown function (DUF4926)